MVRSMFATVIAAVIGSAPVQAQDQIGKIFGGIAQQYLGQEQERSAFAQAQSQNSLAGYQAYLQQFPNGANAAQARNEVQRLGGGIAAPQDQPIQNPAIQDQPTQNQSAGDASPLSTRERSTVQRRLTDLGYDTSGTDGTFGPGTRRAIGLWQRDRNYAQTGSLTAAEADELLQSTTGSATRQQSAGTIDIGPSQTEADLGMNRRERSAVQAGLTRRGFDTRGVDGSFGRGTRDAIAAWQRANDLTSTGYLTAEQEQKLAGQ